LPGPTVGRIRCPVGETRVDLQHLLEDLRDAYTGALEEAILTEVIANALDSGAGAVETVGGRRRPARYGLLVQFESRPDDLEMARLVDSTIWINDAHPAYVRALASRSVGYHTAPAVALASLAVEPADEHAFITQFLAHWGAAASPTRRVARRRVRAKRR
jgi:hypothetical protein